MTQSNPDPEPNPEPESKPEPEPESDLNPEPEVLNHASNDAESTSSMLLLFLPAKIKNAEVHFMINSGAMNNFLSHDLVHWLNLLTNQHKSLIHITFADSCCVNIERIKRRVVLIE